MTYYKAFKKGMICNGKQYAENTDYEEAGANGCCQAGVMHFCKEPFDVLNYYPLVDENGEFTEFATVEPMAEVLEKDDKCASKKIHIGAKLGLKGFIEAAVNVLIEKNGCDKKKINKEAASGNSSQLAASGNSSRLAASGNSSQLAASGNSSQLAASGNYSRLAASGNYSQLAASGNYSRLAASGNSSQLAASGDSSQLAASGDSSRIKMDGYRSVAACVGNDGAIKGKKGCWIVLAEWKIIDCQYTPVCVKAAQIDGELLKEDTFYKLENGEFVEAE